MTDYDPERRRALQWLGGVTGTSLTGALLVALGCNDDRRQLVLGDVTGSFPEGDAGDVGVDAWIDGDAQPDADGTVPPKDVTPPTIEFIDGEHLTIGEILRYGDRRQVYARVTDDLSGIAEVIFELGPGRTSTQASFNHPLTSDDVVLAIDYTVDFREMWLPGMYRVVATAKDHAGNQDKRTLSITVYDLEVDDMTGEIPQADAGVSYRLWQERVLPEANSIFGFDNAQRLRNYDDKLTSRHNFQKNATRVYFLADDEGQLTGDIAFGIENPQLNGHESDRLYVGVKNESLSPADTVYETLHMDAGTIVNTEELLRLANPTRPTR